MIRRNRRLLALLLFLAGIGVVIYVFVSVDRTALADALAQGGWALLPIALYRFTTLAADTVAWRMVMVKPVAVSFSRLVGFRWIGESINNLLPVAQVGGVLVRARLLAATGIGATLAGASVMADFVLGLVAQVIFTLAGLAAFAGLTGWNAELANIAGMLAVGIFLIGLFIVLQRGKSLGRLVAWINRLAPMVGQGAGSGLTALGDHLDRLYAQRGAVVGGTTWRLVGWCLNAGEIWLILNLMGFHIGIAEALVLESMGSAVRSAAFAVPAGVGVQEAGLVGLGLMLGLPAEAGLALALIRRAREVLTSVPGLLVWAATERQGQARAELDGQLTRDP